MHASPLGAGKYKHYVFTMNICVVNLIVQPRWWMVQILNGNIGPLDRTAFEDELNRLKNISVARRDVVDLMLTYEFFSSTPPLSTWRNLVGYLSSEAKIYLNRQISLEYTALKPAKILPLTVQNPDNALSTQVKVHTYRFPDAHKHLQFPELMLKIGNTLQDMHLNPGMIPREEASANTSFFQGVSVSGEPTTLTATVLEQDYMTIHNGAVRAKEPGCSAESFWRLHTLLLFATSTVCVAFSHGSGF